MTRRTVLLYALLFSSLFLDKGDCWSWNAAGGFAATTKSQQQQQTRHRSALFSLHSTGSSDSDNDAFSTLKHAVLTRRACKAFRRADGTPPLDDANNATSSTHPPHAASLSDAYVIQAAKECLDVARFTPSGFNAQPYKVVLVHSQDQKLALSRYCLGTNGPRVLDSDCTAVFLADKQFLKMQRRYREFCQQADRKKRPLPPKTLLYVTVFSSGFPFPRVVSALISFVMRTVVGAMDACAQWLGSCKYKLRRLVATLQQRQQQPPRLPKMAAMYPSLANAETWASKQATMVAMTYMLTCTARGLATLPMEGINARGIRKVLGVPQGRYAIPLIVATGTVATAAVVDGDKTPSVAGNDESTNETRRYPVEELVFENVFGV